MPMPVHTTFKPVDSRKEIGPPPISAPIPRDQVRRKDTTHPQSDSHNLFSRNNRLDRSGKPTVGRQQNIRRGVELHRSESRYEARNRTTRLSADEAQIAHPTVVVRGENQSRVPQTRGAGKEAKAQAVPVLRNQSTDAVIMPSDTQAPDGNLWPLALFGALDGSLFIAGAYDTWKGIKQNNPRRTLRGSGLIGLSAGLACLPGAAVAEATKTPIVTPKPQDTVIPPEITPKIEPELSLNYLNSPNENHPLAPWNTIVGNGVPWIHESYAYDTRSDGSLSVYYGSDGAKYAFATNVYNIPVEAVAPGVIAVEQRTFYMMLRQQTSGGPIEATILVDPSQNSGAALPIYADVYRYSSQTGLEKVDDIQVYIQENADHRPSYTVYQNGIGSPLVTDANLAPTAVTPTPSESDIFNVVYLDKDPSMFIFGGEITVPEPSVTPTPIESPKFTLSGVGLTPELTAALKQHSGLEASITREADGTFSAQITILNSEGQPTTQRMEVTPSTLTENLTSKNKYGDTPVMVAADGTKLYWIQETGGWFAVEISSDPAVRIKVPYGKEEIPARIVITEYNEPFAQAALDRWKIKSGLSLSFQYLTVNANTGEGTKFGYLENRSLINTDVNLENSPVQLLDAWFETTLPDGTVVTYFPMKWLDPANPRDPKGSEWKIIFATQGPEIMNNESNRVKYDQLWNSAATHNSRFAVVPIFKAQQGFFNNTNNLITFGVAQPSLEPLIRTINPLFEELSFPVTKGFTYKTMIDQIWPSIGPTNLGYGIYLDNNNPDYSTNFFSDDVQTLLFPSLIIQK